MIVIEKWNNKEVNEEIKNLLTQKGFSFTETETEIKIACDSVQDAFNLGDFIGYMIRSQS